MLIPAVSIGMFLAVTFAVLAWSSSRERSLEARLAPYGYGDGSPREEELAKPFSERVLEPLIRWLGRKVDGTTPRRVLDRAAERLAMAGHPAGMRAGWFVLMRVAGAASLPLVYLAVLLGMGRAAGIFEAVVLVLFFYFGARLPDIWLGIRIDERQRQIERALPDALDLLTVCVESGKALDAALAKVSTTAEGPLAREMRQALSEMSLGKMRRDALRDMAKRAGVPDLMAFVAALVQAQQTGVSIAQVLRVQSDVMRMKRRQRAEELAAKAPVKMLFPLLLCILPATFVVILGPAAISIWNNILNN